MSETRAALPATTKSDALQQRALELFPGGVNSPVRAYRAVGGHPRIIVSARGARLTDADGHELLDYVLGWGPMLLGHGRPEVLAAVERQLHAGTLFGMTSPLEIELAERARRFYPAAERLRFVSTGTEATMAAIRVARGATGRDAIVKLDGCYHGHADPFLIKAGSGLQTFGVPDSAGTRVATFNDRGSILALFTREPARIAAVVVEPVVGNMGVIPPDPTYLPYLRDLCDRYGALLLFDEVMTGFRVARGGAAERYGVRPDLVTLGKVLGGGLPVAAFGGRADLMKQVAPDGPVYQAGTYSGNPLAMAAGAATLEVLEKDPALFQRVQARTALLAAGLREILTRRRVRGVVNEMGSMWTLYFGVDRVASPAEARRADAALYARFFQGMLARGILLPPSAFESAFLSDAHGEAEIDETLEAADEAMEGMS
ncbi:MAG TPA: glutamate-1-semialdehyde 2,1-aminomutase [Candidatus Polarisedimenticolia bacterium]|nr:glutamate-1-semialdehyde 2,1-aminomutase [Candidatus Polarisedimenticolia bacterium]